MFSSWLISSKSTWFILKRVPFRWIMSWMIGIISTVECYNHFLFILKMRRQRISLHKGWLCALCNESIMNVLMLLFSHDRPWAIMFSRRATLAICTFSFNYHILVFSASLLKDLIAWQGHNFFWGLTQMV